MTANPFAALLDGVQRYGYVYNKENCEWELTTLRDDGQYVRYAEVLAALAAETALAAEREKVARLVEAGPPFFFDRYINGVRMAEDVCVERETTLEGAMRVAARIAAKGPNGEPPVLVYRSTETAARAAIREAGQ